MIRGKTVAKDYGALLQPLKVGGITLKNRVCIAAHTYGFFDARGLPTDSMFYYILERAKGGAALLIMGETLVGSKAGQGVERWGDCTSCDDLIPFYRRLSESVKPYGMKLFDQLFHPGGQVWPEAGEIAYAPSSIAHTISSVVPAEMPPEIIAELIDEFGLAAQRAKMGGLDGIEIKLDQGKLHHQFLSPYFNRRTDDYGGSLENRMRFVIETIESVRRHVGEDFVVGVRVTGNTFPPPDQAIKDLTIDDAKKICSLLTRSGLINYISVNGATNSDPRGYWYSHGDSTIPKANFVQISRIIKLITDLPVLVASQVLHPDDAIQVINSGDADLVAMTRAHIADPEIISKLQWGLIEDIRPCILCNQCCVGNTWIGKELRCIHNAVAGRESEFQPTGLDKVSHPAHIVVIGGGPAGLEFARVAGIRGHHVTLLEKEYSLGGQVLVASKAAHRQRLGEIATFLTSQLHKLANVQIKLRYDASPEDIIALQPDRVVIATGSVPLRPDLPGIREFNCLTVEQALTSPAFKAGDHVVVVDEDWRLHALSVADLLSDLKIKVTLVTSKEYAGKGLNIVDMASYHSRLIDKRISIKPWTEIIGFTSSSVITRNILTSRKTVLKGIDGVVFVNNRQPNRQVSQAMQNSNIPCVNIGDCVFPRGIDQAILEGYRTAMII